MERIYADIQKRNFTKSNLVGGYYEIYHRRKTVCENDKDKAPAESEVIFAEETGGNDEHTALQT